MFLSFWWSSSKQDKSFIKKLYTLMETCWSQKRNTEEGYIGTGCEFLNYSACAHQGRYSIV